MTFYDNYQEADATPSNQDELDEAVAVCKTQLDKAATTPPANTTTTQPPTNAVSTTPPTNPVETTPVETKPVETKPVETKPVETKPVETVPPPPPEAASGGHKKLGLALAIAGGVFEGGAIYFALDGKSKADDVAKATAWDQHTKDLQSAGERDNKLAIGFGVVGAAALVTGVVFLVTGGHATETSVAIVPTGDGAQVGWAGRF
jgi:outer membrane biosynthesis protein TonB